MRITRPQTEYFCFRVGKDFSNSWYLLGKLRMMNTCPYRILRWNSTNFWRRIRISGLDDHFYVMKRASKGRDNKSNPSQVRQMASSHSNVSCIGWHAHEDGQQKKGASDEPNKSKQSLLQKMLVRSVVGSLMIGGFAGKPSRFVLPGTEKNSNQEFQQQQFWWPNG